MLSLVGGIDINETKGNHQEYELMTDSGPNKNLSIKVHGVDIYQSCIDGLLPQRMLNDRMTALLHFLIEYVIST